MTIAATVVVLTNGAENLSRKHMRVMIQDLEPEVDLEAVGSPDIIPSK